MASKFVVKISASEYHNKWVYFILDRYYRRYVVAREMGYDNEKSQKIACYKFGEEYFTLKENSKPFTPFQMSSFKNFLKFNNRTNRVQKFINGENVLTDFKNLSKNMKNYYYEKFSARVDEEKTR